MVLAGDGAGKDGLALGQAGAAVGTPVVQRIYLVLLATEENDVLAQHLHANGLARTHIFLQKGWVPVFTEAHGRDIIEGPDLRGAFGLAPSRLGIVGHLGAEEIFVGDMACAGNGPVAIGLTAVRTVAVLSYPVIQIHHAGTSIEGLSCSCGSSNLTRPRSWLRGPTRPKRSRSQ